MEQSAPWDMPAGDQVDPEEDLRDEEAELEAEEEDPYDNRPDGLGYWRVDG